MTLMTGCQTTGPATRFGTGFGALTGAVLGTGLTGSPEGAVLGAVTGAVAGNLIGQNEDMRSERDGAIAHAQYVEAANAQALRNYDLIRMTQAGVHEEVICNAILTQGGDFQLRTDDIVALKQNGVSDRVLMAAQHAPRPRTARATSTAYVKTSPSVVVVEPYPYVYAPPPPVGVDFYFGGPYRGHRHGHW
jgi:hypothetical protein